MGTKLVTGKKSKKEMFTSGKTVQVKIGGNIWDLNKCCSGNIIYSKKRVEKRKTLRKNYP